MLGLMNASTRWSQTGWGRPHGTSGWVAALMLAAGCASGGGTEPAAAPPLWSAERVAATGLELQWSANFGGASYEEARAVIETRDGNYLAVGWTASQGAGAEDAYVVKVDADGKMLWQSTYGGPGDDRAYAVAELSNGDFVFVGRTSSYGKVEKAYVVRIGPDGSVRWDGALGPQDSTGARSVQVVEQDRVVVAGWTSAVRHEPPVDTWMTKLGADGSVIWERVHDAEKWSTVHEIAQTPDGGFVSAGIVMNPKRGLNGWSFKTDAEGREEWQRAWGNENKGWDEWQGLTLVDDGFVMVGGTLDGRMHAWITKMRYDGEPIWLHRLPRFGYTWRVDATPDGGYVMTGHAPPSDRGTGSDASLMKVDGNGMYQWGFAVGGPHMDAGDDVITTADGGLLLAGYYGKEPGERPGTAKQPDWDRDFWLLKLRPVAR